VGGAALLGFTRSSVAVLLAGSLIWFFRSPALPLADALALDVTRLDDRAWERLAEAREHGTGLWFELPPQTTSGRSGPDVPAQADLVVAPWRRVGLTLADLAGVVLLPRAPSVGATPDEARAELAGVVRAALVVAERAEG